MLRRDQDGQGRAALVLTLALALVGGCIEAEPAEDNLDLLVYTTTGTTLPALQELDSVRVTAVDASRQEVLSQESFDYSRGSGTLAGITYAERMQIVIEGIDSLGNAILRGRSVPFEATRDGRIEPPRIFVSRLDTFAPATALTGSDDNLQPQEVQFQVATPRAGHSAVELTGGILLITGGAIVQEGGLDVPGLPDGLGVDPDGGVLDTVELYDPATGLFFERPPMRIPRAFHTTTVLDDGRVLVTGGVALIEKDDGVVVETVASAEIFDPRRPNEPWELIAGDDRGLAEGRAFHTATLRRGDGRVVVIGGRTISDGDATTLASAEIYDPDRGRFTLNPGDEEIAMDQPRAGHSAELLLTGRGAGKSIIVIGGQNDQGALRSTEVLRVVGNEGRSTFDLGPSMDAGRYAHASLTASPGAGSLVVVAGGYDSNGAPLDGVEVLDVSTGEFSVMTRLNEGRAHTAMFELPQTADLVLLGGVGEGGEPIGPPERLGFDATETSWQALDVDSEMREPRGLMTANRLANGLVLVTGGVTSDGDRISTETAEFFNPDDGVPGFSWDADDGGEGGGFLE